MFKAGDRVRVVQSWIKQNLPEHEQNYGYARQVQIIEYVGEHSIRFKGHPHTWSTDYIEKVSDKPKRKLPEWF